MTFQQTPEQSLKLTAKPGLSGLSGISIFLMLTIGLLSCSILQSKAQNVGINNATPHAKSLLDLTASDKGLLAPRMTEMQRTAMFPAPDLTAKGMLVYQTDNQEGFWFYDGSAWQYIGQDKSNWALTGNAGTNDTINFMGTTDNKDVSFRTVNVERMRIKNNGKIGIGTKNPGSTYPYTRLEIADETGTNSDLMIHTAGGTLSYPQLLFHKQKGTLANPLAVGANEFMGTVIGRGFDGATYGNVSAVVFSTDSAAAPGFLRGNIAFHTAGGATAEKMRIDRNGNTGIGTNAPIARLHVLNNDSNWATASLRNMNVKGYSGQWFQSSNGQFAGHIGYGNASSPLWSNTVYAGSIVAVPFVLTTADKERMRIDANGNVGIDTVAPQAKLHVRTNSWVGQPQIMVDEKDSADYARVTFKNGGSNKYWTVAGMANTVDTNSYFNIYHSTNSNLMVIKGDGKVALGNFSPPYPLSFPSTLGDKISLWGWYGPHYGMGIAPSLFQIHAANVNDDIGFGYGSSGAFTENMRIKGTGLVGIGTINPMQKLDVSGNINVALDSNYRIGNQRVLSVKGTGNFFAGINAGISNGAGLNNTFTGNNAGQNNTAGGFNSFYGHDAGKSTTMGNQNTFVGDGSGTANTTGTANTFIGQAAGASNIGGGENTFIGLAAGGLNTAGTGNTFTGSNAGYSNTSNYNTFTGYYSGKQTTTGSFNTFSGTYSGMNNTIGTGNSFYGVSAGNMNTAGQYNTYLGSSAGSSFTSGSNNLAVGSNAGTFSGTGNSLTLIGSNADVLNTNLSNATAIGFNAKVSASNSLVLGGTGVDAVKVGIGTQAPAAELEVNGYTMLGSSGPAIKMAKFTGTTALTQTGSTNIIHSLNPAKILSVDVLVEFSPGNYIHPAYSYNTGYNFNYYVTSTTICVANINGSSSLILGKPIKVVVVYEQ